MPSSVPTVAPLSERRHSHVVAPLWAGPDGFAQYEEDVAVWLHLTELADNKKGGALRMSLSGVAYDAARKVTVAALIRDDGHIELLSTLRAAFGGSDFKRVHTANRRLRTLYRGSRGMEVYLAEVGQALAECGLNGHEMSHNVAGALILDQSGLDQTQQATTLATAVSLRGNRNPEAAISVALRDLWGGGAPLRASADAVMMVVTYAQHEAYMARQTKPLRPRPHSAVQPRLGTENPAVCWYCSKKGHIASVCRKRMRDEAATHKPRGVVPPPGQDSAAESAVVSRERVHLVTMTSRVSPATAPDDVAHERVNLILAAHDSPRRCLAVSPGDVVLDIGATATIAGTAWVSAFVARLPSAQRHGIVSEAADAVFKYGGGATERARERVTLPLRIGGRATSVRTWVVNGSLPMLLSRQSMASMGVVLDVAAPRMQVSSLDAVVDLSLSPSGLLTFNGLHSSGSGPSHSPPPSVRSEFPRALVAVLTASSPSVHADAVKLHKQYGHAPAARLNALLKDQGVTDPAVFSKVTAVVAACDACALTGPRPPRPLDTIPRGLRVNDAVAVDVAEVDPQHRFLHMVDLGTLFAKAVHLPDKETRTVSRAFVAGWLVHHGPPRHVLADPGPEFDSNLWRTVGGHFNIAVESTAAQAHFSNGVVERHNAMIKTMLRRMRLDRTSAAFQELLDLACMAKNSMGTHAGATPFQLMCGTTPRVPTAFSDALPALSERRVPGDDCLHETLSALHAARLAHTQAEADQSLRRALARNATNVPVRSWARGDVVYYWTEGTGVSAGAWQGPAHVTDVAVAKDAVRLQHGNNWLNRQLSELRPVPSHVLPVTAVPDSSSSDPRMSPPSSPTPGSPVEEGLLPSVPTPPSPVESREDASRAMLDGAVAALIRVGAPAPSAPSPHPPLPPPPAKTPWTGRTRGRPHQHAGSVLATCESSDAATLDATGPLGPSLRSSARSSEASDNVWTSDAPTARRDALCRPSPRPLPSSVLSPTPPPAMVPSDALRLFARRADRICTTASTTSVRASRLRGARGQLLLTLVGSDELDGALKRAGVDEHPILVTRREQRSRAEVPVSAAGAAFDDAMADELGSWAGLGVEEEVAYTGQHVISTRRVLTIKEPAIPTEPPRHKARLVMRGFKDQWKEFVDSTSPTAARASLRLLLSALSSYGFAPHTVDVRTAFLQGLPLDRPNPVFVRPPPQARAPSGVVWRLRKCAYGLTDAPRRWYESVLLLMRDSGLSRCSLDHGLFARHRDGAPELVVAVHVDDFLFGGTASAVRAFEASLRGRFSVGPTKVGSFSFTGLSIRTLAAPLVGAPSILVDQDAYVDTIDTIDIRPMRVAAPSARLDSSELTAYRRATGDLLWATGQTMPWLACAAALLARRFTCAVVADLAVANRFIAAARRARPHPLTFPLVAPAQRLRLFVDASSVKNGVPTAHSGFVVFASPSLDAGRPLAPDTPLTLLRYGSHCQRRVTHSSFAAEVYAVLEGVRATMEMAAVHVFIYSGDEYAQPPIDVFTDNLSPYNTLDADGVVMPKEIGAAVQVLRELYRSGALATVTWLRARGQLADILTKPGRSSPLEHTVRTGFYNVRLGPGDFLTKSAAVGHPGVPSPAL